jgi:glyoxylate reductase
MSRSGASVFVTRRIPAAGLEVLRRAGVPFAVGQEDEERGLDRGALLEGVRTHDVLLCLLTDRIDREVLTCSPRLRGVSNMAVGLDNVDLAAAAELGIPVGSTPGVLTDATADLTWALLLATARRVPEAHAYMAGGRFRLWGPNLLLGRDVGPGVSGRSKVLGIVGFGRIGRAVAARARGFRMEVLAFGRDRARIEAESDVAYAPLDELLERSDFVSLHVPLSAQTRHLIGAAELARMRPTAFLINTARGPVVDERALVEALREGTIAGAGLDVFEDEPQMAPGLAELPNVVLLPHIGSASHETRDAMAVRAAQNALRFAGVDPDRAAPLGRPALGP